MEKTTFKEKTNNLLIGEREKNFKEIGYFTALNKIEDILDKEDDITSLKRKINSLSFGKFPF